MDFINYITPILFLSAFSIYISLTNISGKNKHILIIILIILILFTIFSSYKNYKKEKDLDEAIKNTTESTNIISQKSLLYQIEGITIPFSNKLGKNPIYHYYFNKGLESYIKNNYYEAIDEFNEALDISTLNVISLENTISAYTFLGNCFINIGDTEKAKLGKRR